MNYSIKQAVKRKIDRLRSPGWAHPMDHIRIDRIDDTHGPWAHMHSPMNKAVNGRDPVDILILPGKKINAVQLDPDRVEWEPYGGVLPGTQEWNDEEQQYTQRMAK